MKPLGTQLAVAYDASVMLDTAERRVLEALGDTLFPDIGSGDPGGGGVVPTGFDIALGRMGPEVAKQLRTALSLFEWSAVLSHGRRFSRLDAARRERYVNAWMHSRLKIRRAVYKALRDLLGHVYYQDPKTWPFIGYAGPPVGLEETP